MNRVISKRVAILSGLTIAIVSIVTYLPGLKIGFLDGWWYLQWAATMNFPRYAIQFLDPANITQGYRPVQGLYIYLLYHLVGFNPDGYHVAHILLHAANGVLLFAIVWRLSREWRIAFIAALFYVSSPVYSLAVFWHAVVDPLAGFFYLLTILLWIEYLESGRRLYWALTFGAYLLALFSKETAIFLPLILFLIEWWFFGRKPSLSIHVPRYAPFVAAWVPYLYLVLQVQSHGEFVGQFGFRLGPHMITNLVPYLAVLAFPWTINLPTDAIYYIWLAVVILIYLAMMLYRKSTVLLFLAIIAILNISPLTGFPLDYFNTRYLYLSLMASVILLALLIHVSGQVWGKHRAYAMIAPVVVTLLLLGGGLRIANAASDLAEFTRQIRVPFRDISREHPTFPDDSYLYFVYSPMTSLTDFEGLFFVRYGMGITVDGTDSGRFPDWQSHNAAFVYYFDSTGRPIELPVDKNARTRSTPRFPIRYLGPITLESYTVPSATLYHGKALVIVLSWSTVATPDKDYTLFAHLTNANGQTIAEFDGPPRRGAAPTSQWRRGQLIVDALVLPIDQAPVGDNYRLEVGMYDAATMKRLPIVNDGDQVIGDTVVIEPFRIAP